MSNPQRLLTVCALLLAGSAAAADTSRVCRFTLPAAVDGRWDMQVILFHRDGALHHGYALVPGRDNVPHRVDVTPSLPIQWQTADGRALDVPESMRGRYSYKRPEFGAYKQRFADGEIRIAHPTPTPPIAWEDGRLTGCVDVLIAPVNLSNATGRAGLDVAYRIAVDARGGADGPIAGRATWWTYAEDDDAYAPQSGRTTVELQDAAWDAGYWSPAPDAALAPGRDWPQARGPALTGGAVASDRPLVDNLDDARLVWVSEETVGGGRGAVLSRGDFAMFPYAWQNIGYGGFAGVTVADGKVFQYLTHPDERRVADDPEIAANVYVQLGADPRTMANDRGHMRDTVLCLDARTGRTLWWFKSTRTFANVREGKGGIGMTACFHDGRLFARGSGGLYALDAETGRLLWNAGGGRLGDTKIAYGPRSGWSHDESPVIIGDALLIGFGEEGLAAVDPATGEPRWAHAHVKGENAVPTRVDLGGKPYIIVCGRDTPTLSLIDPRDGRIVWQSDALGPNHGSLAVWGDIVCGNGADTPATDETRAAAVRVSLDGAERIWTSDAIGYPGARSVPVAHDGCFYIDDRSRFGCLDAETGRLVNRQPHIYHLTGGSHNWVWTIASNNRIVTSGVIMFSDGPEGFRIMPGRLSLDLAGGYMCPIRPAMADGRLFCRLADKIVCYDLRRPAGLEATTFDLTAPGAFASSTAPGDAVRLRLRAVEGRPPRVSALWPEIVGPEAAGEAERIGNKWVAGYRHALPWRTGPAPDLRVTDTAITGTFDLPMGWHFERWTVDLSRSGERVSGTYTRAVPALAEPRKVSGRVTGAAFSSTVGKDPDPAPITVLSLDQAVSQNRRNPDLKPLKVVIVGRGDGARAWAVADGTNGIAHEADPSGLTFGDDGRIAGTLTVLLRDDGFFHLNPDAKTAVACLYTVDARADADGRITGTHRGTFGAAWSRSGRLDGAVAAD